MNTEKIFIAIGLTLLVGMMVLLAGCAAQRAVPTYTERDSVAVRTEVRVDSVYRDRWHVVWAREDTVFVRDSVVCYRERVLHHADTVRLTAVDSIAYPVEVVREVRRRNGYDRFVSWGFWVLVVIIGGIGVIRIARILRKVGVI